MKFIVDRQTWMRGRSTWDGDSCESMLHNWQGRRCCLGFYLKAVGFTDDEMRCGLPHELVVDPEDADLMPDWLVDVDPADMGATDTYDCDRIVEVNDSRTLTDTEREAALKNLFAAQGIEVVFTDDTPAQQKEAPHD